MFAGIYGLQFAQIEDTALEIAVDKPEERLLDICNIQYGDCIRYGSVLVMGAPLLNTGMHHLAGNILVEIRNSKSYSRVTIQAKSISLQVRVLRKRRRNCSRNEHAEQDLCI